MSLELLDELRETFRKLETLPEDAAKLAAPLVLEPLRATARAGTDATGKPWIPKKDGSAPLVHAADHITCKARGKTVVATLTGVDAYHHFGAGVPLRPILPDPGTVPPGVAAALKLATDRAFALATGSA